MTLRCELSKAGVPVEWRRDGQLLKEGGKYQMKQEGRAAELLISDLALSDAAEYSCLVGTVVTSADIRVRGEFPFSLNTEQQRSAGDSSTVEQTH